MILRFDEYNHFNDLIKLHTVDDDNFLNERLSISEDVISETKRVVDYIQSEINNGNFNTIKPAFTYRDVEMDIVKLSNYSIKLFGKDCDLPISITRIVSEDKTNSINTSETNAEILSDLREINSKTCVEFQISGNIIFLNGEITDGSVGVLGHEIRHAYEKIQIYDGKPVVTTQQIVDAWAKWSKIYRNAVSYLIANTSSQKIKLNNETNFYNLIYTIYSSDISELSAFTQHTYEQCKKCKTISELTSSMKKSKLRKMIDGYDNILTIMENPEIQDHFNQKIAEYNLDLPSLKRLTKLFKKRCKKAKSNYGKVFAFIKEEIDSKDGELIFTDVKY